jgi:pimeloyl-ACP methyl ester carboxylesterase
MDEVVVDRRLELVEIADLGGGVRIAYDEFGDRSDPTLLLVMGLGMQMLGWYEEFCEMLVERGFHVVRYDNRDAGLSSKHRGNRRPNVIAGAIGLPAGNPYDLGDMAGDAAGLLDHLEVDHAHLVGASMGGMIAQTLAFRHRERVLSLCSIMSSPGGRRVATMPRMSVLGALLSRPPAEREAYARHVAKTFEKIGSPGYDTDAQRLRERTLLAFDRCFCPGGTARQLAAIVASGDRTRDLASITAPTLVIHGTDDKLLPSAGGVATAEAIPAARLELIEGMGHDLPIELLPHIADLIAENAARAKPAAAVS